MGIQGDVSNLADLDRLYATIEQEQGHLDVIFANAGGGICSTGSIPKNTLTKHSTPMSGSTVHRAEGTAADARGRFHHPECLN